MGTSEGVKAVEDLVHWSVGVNGFSWGLSLVHRLPELVFQDVLSTGGRHLVQCLRWWWQFRTRDLVLRPVFKFLAVSKEDLSLC